MRTRIHNNEPEKAISTSKSDYQVPVSSTFESEKSNYRNNKERSTAGGDWWGNYTLTTTGPNADFVSNYKDSFGGPAKKIEAELSSHRRKKTITANVQEAVAYNIITGIELNEDEKHHSSPKRVSSDKVRKAEEGKDGRHYNIITNVLGH